MRISFTRTLWNRQQIGIYICQVTASGEATAFLNTTSAMEFSMFVQIYDANFNMLLSEDISEVSTSVYNGQRIRKRVTAGQYIVIGIEMFGSNFVTNSYDFGVLRHDAVNDLYEPNNHPDNSHNIGVFVPNNPVINSNIDSQFDVDWYK